MNMHNVKSDMEMLDTGFQRIKKGEAAAKPKRVFTREDADKAIARLKELLPDWVTVSLMGSVAEKGQSEKDIDILVTLDYNLIPGTQGGTPPIYVALDTMNAEFVQHGENGSEWYDWDGLILDIHIDEQVALDDFIDEDYALSSTRFPTLTRLIGKKIR